MKSDGVGGGGGGGDGGGDGGGGGGGGGGNTPGGNTPGGGAQELVVLFDLATDEFVQALSLGTITNNAFYGPEGGPANIPLVAAGSPSLEIVEGPGEQAVSLKITNAATWGDGIDLPYSKFLFKTGDKIIIEGTIDTLPAGNRVQLNKSVGSENATIGGTDTKITSTGEFKIEVVLADADVSALRSGSPSGLRFEMRSVAGIVATIDNIHIEGMRGAEIIDMILADFDIENEGLTAQFEGSVEGWTITAKEGFSEGAITVHYEGIAPTVYAKSTTVPQAAGTYKVTFDIAAAGKFNAGSYEAGTLTVMPAAVNMTVTSLYVGGTGTIIKSGGGVEFTKTSGYQNSYTQFQIDFGSGKTIADFTGISLHFLGIEGDLGWKNFAVVAQEGAFSGAINWEAGGSDVDKLVAPANATGYNGLTEKAFSWTFSDEIKTALAGKQTIHFAIIFHANSSGGSPSASTKYQIYDVMIASGSVAPINVKFQ